MDGAELLSRDQLKSILGGQKAGFDDCSGDHGCPDGQFPCTCESGSGCAVGCVSTIQECWNLC